MNGLAAGAASTAVAPPPGLPMVGFVRQWQPAEGPGRLPLETTVLVLAERLFPERAPWPAERGWLASGAPVPPTAPERPAHPGGADSR